MTSCSVTSEEKAVVPLCSEVSQPTPPLSLSLHAYHGSLLQLPGAKPLLRSRYSRRLKTPQPRCASFRRFQMLGRKCTTHTPQTRHTTTHSALGVHPKLVE